MPTPSGSTPKHGLSYPYESDVPDIPTWGSGLATTLDTIIATDSQGVLAGRPSAGIAGRYYWATDTGQLFRDDGTNWNPPATLRTHAFTTSGSWVVPNDVSVIELLLVGGGGAGSCQGGGGGGGQVVPYRSIPVAPGETLTLTLGAGGAGVAGGDGGNGSNSTCVGTGVNVVAYGGTGGAAQFGGLYGGTEYPTAHNPGYPNTMTGVSLGVAPMGCGGAAPYASGCAQIGGSEPFSGFGGGGGCVYLPSSPAIYTGAPGGGTSGGAGAMPSGIAGTMGGGGGGCVAGTGGGVGTLGGAGGNGYAEIRWVS